MKNKFTQRHNSNSNNYKPKYDMKVRVTFIILVVMWTLGSILGTIGFISSLSSSSSKVYADELTGSSISYRYDSDNFFVPQNRILRVDANSPSSSSMQSNAIIMAFKTIVEHDTKDDFYYISFSVASGTSYFLQSISQETGEWVNHGYTVQFTPSIHNGVRYYFASSTTAQYIYGSLRINIDPNFNLGSVKAFSYSSNYTNASSMPIVNDLYNLYNTFSLLDANNNRCSFSLIYYSPVNQGIGWVQRYSWTDRTYYINTDFSDNEYYQKGLYDGEMSTKDKYFQEGFDAGDKVGFVRGENSGYSKGVESANKYSFLGLLTAVVDAPIQALSGFFNFDILGFNMLGFVQAIFTAMIIVIVIKLIVGGGKGG